MNAGKCDSCKYTCPLYEFRNDLVEPEIRFSLCPACMRKAYTCMAIFIRTPVGRKRFIEKYGTPKGVYVKEKLARSE